MAAKHPETLYCCDICGEEELTEDDMRSHTMIAHIEGAISCPFCDLGDISADEMVYHVNTVHLQYLNPVGEMRCTVNSNNSPDRLTLSENNNIEDVRDAQCCSPHRSNLSLSLSTSQWRKDIPNGCITNGERITTCPLCDYGDPSPTKLQEHVNRQHFDLTSPSFPELVNCDRSHGRPFTCPLCNRNFETSPDLELHVNMDHHDILSPAKSTQVTPGDENSNECCPVCGCSNFNCGLELASHIEEHFSQQSPNGVIPTPRTSLNFVGTVNTDGDASADHLLALEMEHREREQQRLREQQEFRLLQAQYGMDNQGNFREQSITNMQRAVYAGEMSVTDYYNRQVELCIAERDGVDDGHSCIKGLIPKVRAFSMATANVEHTWLCTTIDHYGSTYGDKGWGCGYRNIQMLLSALVHHTGYNHRLFNVFPIDNTTRRTLLEFCYSNAEKKNRVCHSQYGIIQIGRNSIPSISKLQELIETAWRHGFDPQGCEQLGGRLINTRKWIGATEVVTFLSSFRIKCLLIDCHTPTGPNGTHPEMFQWVKEYFTRDEDFLSPVYLQHHGHSRTIIGIEELKDGELQLLVFDPSHSKAQMEQFNNTACNANAMRLLRRPLSALKARQYQLVTVNGLMESEEEFQRSKILRSQRIPPN